MKKHIIAVSGAADVRRLVSVMAQTNNTPGGGIDPSRFRPVMLPGWR
jgi:hypothetical protein